MSELFLPAGKPMVSKAVSGGYVVMLRHPITPNLAGEHTTDAITELRRRWADRNIPGYWGCNARAWIRKIIRQLRETQ